MARIGKIPVFALAATVATPEDSSFVLMYQLSTDGLVYIKDASGVSTPVGSSSLGTTDPFYGECASASSTVYTVTIPVAITAYVKGQTYKVKFDATNAITTNPTLNINALGAKNLKKNGTTNLAAGDIVTGRTYEVMYDGTNLVLQYNQVIAKTALTAADASVIIGGGAAILTNADKAIIDNIRIRLNEVVAALGL